MGAILRAAGCFNANEIRYSGERYSRAAKFSTDTKDAQQKITLNHAGNLLANLPTNASVVAVELVTGAVSLADFVHPENAIYLFGPEDGSLSQTLVDAADHVIYIPTIGCLNLAATVNVVLYDRQAKLNIVATGDSTIRASRDRNNNLNRAD
jgi:tRNA(Leu) C34 or U34 (ribose-2'-O)-methylase TrmL